MKVARPRDTPKPSSTACGKQKRPCCVYGMPPAVIPLNRRSLETSRVPAAGESHRGLQLMTRDPLKPV